MCLLAHVCMSACGGGPRCPTRTWPGGAEPRAGGAGTGLLCPCPVVYPCHAAAHNDTFLIVPAKLPRGFLLPGLQNTAPIPEGSQVCELRTVSLAQPRAWERVSPAAAPSRGEGRARCWLPAQLRQGFGVPIPRLSAGSTLPHSAPRCPGELQSVGQGVVGMEYVGGGGPIHAYPAWLR